MYNTTHTSLTNGTLPTDIIQVVPITDPAQITAIMEADTLKDEALPVQDKPTEDKPEHPQAASTPTQTTQAAALVDALTALLTPIIERMVGERIAALIDNTMTLTKLDADIEQKMRDIADEVADEKISYHERREEHWSEDYLCDRIHDAISDHDGIVSERQIEEMISDAIDNHCSDMEHLEEDDVDTKLGDYVSTENFAEVLTETLRKYSFTLTKCD